MIHTLRRPFSGSSVPHSPLATVDSSLTTAPLCTHVQQGSHVEEFEKICEVQSDKAAVEITSRYAGVIKQLHHSVGELVQVRLAVAVCMYAFKFKYQLHVLIACCLCLSTCYHRLDHHW